MNPSNDAWDLLRAAPPTEVLVRGSPVTVGQYIRLKPRPGGDIMDLALSERTATVASIEVTTDGEPHFAVTIDDDPGRDLGTGRYPGHRFFFRADEIVLLDTPVNARPQNDAPVVRVLVAGIGNIFFGDDGFGVAVARRLADTRVPGVTVRDFGIRGMDLVYALHDGYDLAILIDSMARRGEPGTIYVVDPDLDNEGSANSVTPTAHGLDPVRALHLARSLGRIPDRLVILGCEPQTLDGGEALDDTFLALSPVVGAAVDEAVRVVERLITAAAITQSKGEAQCP